jgi:hypothetical protein
MIGKRFIYQLIGKDIGLFDAANLTATGMNLQLADAHS